MSRPVVLVILDGWGIAPPGPGNAVDTARTPQFDALLAAFPHTSLRASGPDVGLPDGQMGNSEVGHLAIGAGRVVPQDLVRIATAAADAYTGVDSLENACRRAREGSGTLHLIGLVSDGGVHSHVDHLRGLVALAERMGVPRAAVHAITDGRDVAPHQALDLLPTLEEEWRAGPAVIVDVCGRYYAMDRDGRQERTDRAARLYREGRGRRAGDLAGAIQASYAEGVSDEFIEPVVLDPTGTVGVGEEVVFFNFRPDRARQICQALTVPETTPDGDGAEPPRLTAMTAYWDGQPGSIAFPEDRPSEVLADALEAAGIGQLHIAETEKYAHVTYFLNGGREREHRGEDRILVPSPRDVATYDERPEMSAEAVRDAAVEGITDGGYGFVVVNFANPDMVGHTGSISAVVEAVECVDRCLGDVIAAAASVGGVAVVTADHGNAEQMLAADGSPHTAHTVNPVPLVITAGGLRVRDGGRLADLAPTVLDLLGVEQPASMTGRTLLVRD